MTEPEFLDLITSKSAKAVLERLSKLPQKDRRAFSKPALTLFKKLDRVWMPSANTPDVTVKDGDAVTIAVFATASASELKKFSIFPRPAKIPFEDIVRALQPDWLQVVVDHFVEDRVVYVELFKPLWQAGLCQRPASDAVILGYYNHWVRFRPADEKALLDGDVWRFFEVEGGGEDSLANHDKFVSSSSASWAQRLRRYADDGKLDRGRLLDASLDALDRDFSQYRAGWYSRFHVLMAPDADETHARADRYLRLLASSIPPTVSFALKHVQALEKEGKIEPRTLLAALDPVLQARSKGTVSSALKLLRSAVKRQPDLHGDAASKAVLALISEDADVQGKALDAIEALGPETVASELADYVDLVAPSVRPRIAALSGVSADTTPVDDLVTGPANAQPVVSVASAQDALSLFLSVLENPREPLEVEQAMDGISRFGAALRADAKALSPLRKRAKQVCASPGECDLRYVLALTGRAMAEGIGLTVILSEESDGRTSHSFVPDHSLQEFHLARNVGVLERIGLGHSVPLLSLPSDTSGMVRADDLLSRMTLYRSAGFAPDPKDLSLALMRLNPEDRSAKELPVETEADRAVAYALGKDVTVGPTSELWAAAWCARLTEQPDETVAAMFKKPTPDCGVPAGMALMVTALHSEDGMYSWVNVSVPVTPENEIKSRALPALFGAETRKYFDNPCCGETFADIAWASLTRPADPEPFFRIGLLQQDTWQKLADNPTRAFLEPFFRPGPAVGPLGAGMLAFYMACEDKSVTSLATEATATLASEGRLTAARFAAGLTPFLMSKTLPTGRWTRAMKAVSDFGAGTFAKDVLVGLLDFEPAETPKDIGGLLELCYELHLAQDANLEDASAIACLKTIPGGGKTARFAKKLLERATPQAG